MRWTDVGCSSLHDRHISFDLSYDTAALLFWRVLHFLLVFFYNNTTRCRMVSTIIIPKIPVEIFQVQLAMGTFFEAESSKLEERPETSILVAILGQDRLLKTSGG